MTMPQAAGKKQFEIWCYMMGCTVTTYKATMGRGVGVVFVVLTLVRAPKKLGWVDNTMGD